MGDIRLIDLGFVDPIRSQTIYHAVAYALDAHTPDTIILVSPGEPYVSIGFHQELEKEVDVEYCRTHNLPIVRREVGGGAVYLDRNQLFMQWIFHQDSLPRDISDRFALYVRPIVDTYHQLGIPAYYRPVNDIHVEGKKIGGTGAARMGMAEVVVGSFMFDFNPEVMSHIIKVSSEKMRDKIFNTLNKYLTTMTHELGYPPARSHIIDLYLEQAQTALGRRILRGELTAGERARAEDLDRQFATDEWLHQKGGLRYNGVKIHQDIHVREVSVKTPGGLVRVIARVRDGQIDDVTISGDFTMLPISAAGLLELALRGMTLETGTIRACVEEVYDSVSIQSPGLTTSDLTNAIMLLSKQ